MVFRSNRHLSLVATSISWCLTILPGRSFGFIPKFTLTSTSNDDNDELIDYTSCASIYAIIIIIHFYFLLSFVLLRRTFFVFSSLVRSLFIVHCFMYVCMCLMTEKKRNEKPGYVARQNSYYCYAILANVSGNTNEQTS